MHASHQDKLNILEGAAGAVITPVSFKLLF
jgi:hypothetical protein